MKRWVLILTICLLISLCQLSSAQPASSGKIVHYTLYVTDGYVNTASGVWPPTTDNTVIAGWPKPLYIWGFTDIDPNITANLMTVPAGAIAPKGGPVGNAKFPAPFLEVKVGDDVYLTVHNRGFYQKLQKVQDDHTVHLHGIHAQAQYDGFPESAGGYTEQMRYFWEESWYLNCGGTCNPLTSTTQQRDTWWNGLLPAQQTSYLTSTPITKPNTLNAAGGITSQFNLAPPPLGVGGLTPAQVANATQYTYYFRAEFPGTYMYHCHVAASEHVQMGMYGALIIRPDNYDIINPTTWTVYGTSATSYTKEYTLLLSEIDPNWHAVIEGGKRKAFYPPNWKPELWFVNGRTFPTTVLAFNWNKMVGGLVTAEREPRYDTYMNVSQNDRILIRYINMGYQEHPMHQHGWHMKVVGSDAREFTNPLEKYTLLIGSGETYDTITTANPVYGVAYPQGARLGQSIFTDPPLGSTPVNTIRQIFPIHDHDDYRVTTNGIYPGGALVLMEATGIPGAVNVTWVNPYVPPPGIEVVPIAPPLPP